MVIEIIFLLPLLDPAQINGSRKSFKWKKEILVAPEPADWARILPAGLGNSLPTTRPPPPPIQLHLIDLHTA